MQADVLRKRLDLSELESRARRMNIWLVEFALLEKDLIAVQREKHGYAPSMRATLEEGQK